MTADRSPLDPADEEETREAAALQVALEGRAASPSDVPEGALEAAALLRFSTERGLLSAARRSSIRTELLAALPEPRRAGRGARLRWVFLPLGLLGAAFAALLVVKGESDPTASSVAVAPRAQGDAREQAPRARGEAAPPAAQALAERSAEGGGAATNEWTRSAREARSKLLRAMQPEIARAHELADRASTPVELEQAERVLAALALEDSEFSAAGVEARWVRQDLFCRLAEVALRQGQPRSALEWTARGLALDGPDSAFLAQLHALDGEAKGLLGDETGAAASYMKALRINERLLHDSLGGSDPPPPAKVRKP